MKHIALTLAACLIALPVAAQEGQTKSTSLNKPPANIGQVQPGSGFVKGTEGMTQTKVNRTPVDPAPQDGAGTDADAPPAPVEGEDSTELARDVMQAIFYHEFGHALIDVMQLPVLGLEEDASDVLSVVMIDRLWEPESAESKLRAAAGFWARSAAETAAAGGAPDLWGVHSPDERRYGTYVCLFYGASPDTRQALAEELGLPEDRAASCPDEWALAQNSWGKYLDELQDSGAGETLQWVGETDDNPITAALHEEVTYLNSIMTLPTPISVQVASCDEVNAFYDPETKTITMCSEMIDYVMGSDQ